MIIGGPKKDKPKIGAWYRWFAWRPVRLESGGIAWMEYVKRRESYPSEPTTCKRCGR